MSRNSLQCEHQYDDDTPCMNDRMWDARYCIIHIDEHVLEPYELATVKSR